MDGVFDVLGVIVSLGGWRVVLLLIGYWNRVGCFWYGLGFGGVGGVGCGGSNILS